MRSPPYRIPGEPPEPVGAWKNGSGGADLELLPAFFLLWLACAVRTASAVVHHEPFTGELSLTALVVLLLPWVVWEPVRGLVRRLRDGIKER